MAMRHFIFVILVSSFHLTNNEYGIFFWMMYRIMLLFLFAFLLGKRNTAVNLSRNFFNLLILRSTIYIKFYVGTLKSRNSKKPELDWTDLPQNSNFGREFAQKSRIQKSGVQIPVGEGQIFLFLFLFIFIFSIKNWILKHKMFFYSFTT